MLAKAKAKAATDEHEGAVEAREKAEKDRDAAALARQAAAAAATEISQLKQAADIERQQTRKSRAEADAFLAGVEAWANEKIIGIGAGETVKSLAFAKMDDTAKYALRDALSPAWDRIWQFVKTQSARLSKLVTRELEVENLVTMAVVVRAKASNSLEALNQALEKLPKAMGNASPVIAAKSVAKAPQGASDDEFDAMLAAYTALQGRSR